MLGLALPCIVASTRRQVALSRLRARQADFTLVRSWRPGMAISLMCPDCATPVFVDPRSPTHSFTSGPLPSIAPGIVCSGCGCGYAFVNGATCKLNGRPAIPVASPPEPEAIESPVTPVPGVAPSAESLASGSSQPPLSDLPWPSLLALARKLGVPTRGVGSDQRSRVDIEADLATKY